MFLGLSKLLNQEDALGAPCLDTVIALRRSVLAGAGILRTGVIRHFGVTLRLATPDIRLASADAFAVVGGGCTGRAHGCKAKQGRRGKEGADVCSYSHSSTVLEPRRERADEEFFGNHVCALLVLGGNWGDSLTMRAFAWGVLSLRTLISQCRLIHF